MNDAIPRPQAKSQKVFTPLLEIRNLTKTFDGQNAVEDVSLTIYKGEIFALLGPSGCGKSTLLRMLAGFEQPSEGQIVLDGQDMSHVPPYQRPINMMFQSYALFPHMTVEQNIAFGLKQDKMPRAAIAERVAEMLALVHMQEYAKRKPHQLSGGMSQRVMIAMAIACRPKLLIADEPTTALDVTIQAQIIELLLDLQQRENMALLLITHDLALVAEAAHHIIVMYAGQVVESGKAAEIFRAPRHPYTQALLRALPEFAADKARLASLPGVVPGKYDRPTGCLLNPRCPYANERCRNEEPELRSIPGRQVKCHTPLDDAGRPTV